MINDRLKVQPVLVCDGYNGCSGAPWSAANRLPGQRTGAFSWRPVLRPFQEDRPIPTRPYPEQRTCMMVRSGVISVFISHSGNAQASTDMRSTSWLCPACLLTNTSTPTHIKPKIAITNYTYTPTVTCPPSTRSSSASVGHYQAPVVMQQQRHS